MRNKKVVGSMSEWSGVLKDFHRQIDDGSKTLEMVQAFLENQNPFQKPDYITDWQNFYLTHFGIKADFSSLTIPKKKKGFDRLLIIPKGMTPQTVYSKCKELFLCWKYTGRSLDKVTDWTKEARDPRKGAYVIWIRDRVEAGKELKNLSANNLKEKNIPGITLTERLIYELKYYTETKEHLDIENITLCSGSRSADGSVPKVRWGDDECSVDWYNSGYVDDFLRSREVVS